MKKRAIGVIVLATAFLGASGATPETADEPGRSKIEGTWEHVFEDQPKLRQIKVINQDHFMWITYDRETNMSLYSAGGSYILRGNTYKEWHEFGRFGGPKLQELVGHEQVFTVEVKGDTLTLTGTLSNGMELAEVWKRLR